MSWQGAPDGGGAGYRTSDAASALRGEDTSDEHDVASKADEPSKDEVSSSSQKPSPTARWQMRAREMAEPDKERHELGGGWRSFLRVVTFGGYKGLEPKKEWERRLMSQRALAPTPNVGVGVIVVAQPKGGVGKTPAAMLTACALRSYARKSPVVWDCNENAGARWSVGPWARTSEYLMTTPEGGTVLSQVEATAIDQDDQAYEVIAAPTPPRNLTDEEFSTIHDKLSQRYTQIVIDTGNTVTASNLVNAVAAAHVVIVPTDLAPATMGPTLALFKVLEDKWGENWSSHVIGLETGIVPEPDPEWREFFKDSCAEVVQVPFDPHIASKGLLLWSEMSEDTKDACRHLAGAITDVYRNTNTNGNE